MKKTLALTASLLLSISIMAQEMMQWRGPNRDGHYPETGLLKQWPEGGPELLWHFEGLGPGHASATVTDKWVFTAGTQGEDNYVFAFDHDGNLLWKKKTGKEWVESYSGARTTPLFYQNKLYTMTAYGKILCMSAENGQEIWTKNTMEDFDGRNIKWGVTENLLIYNDKLFCTVGGEDANVIALNPLTGKLIWKHKGEGDKSAYCSPTAFKHGDLDIFVTMTESHILGFDSENGKLLWSFDWPNKYSVHANTPLYHDGEMYFVSGYGKGSVKLRLSDNGKSVTEVWQNSEQDNRIGGVVLHDGILYGAGDFSRTWLSTDWETGKTVKSDKIFKRTGTSIFADGMWYGYSETGEIGLIDPNGGDFKVISVFEVPYGADQHWAHLVIVDKKMYVRHGDALMVYDIAE